MREPLKDNKSYGHALTDVKAWRISEFENVDALNAYFDTVSHHFVQL